MEIVEKWQYTNNLKKSIRTIRKRRNRNREKNLFKHKVGASVVACRRDGALNAIDTSNHFFLNQEMFVVGSTYWNMVYGQMPGDIEKDEEGMVNMENLGKNMAFLLKKICK